MTLFYHADGKPSMHPTTQEQAKRLRRTRYDSGTQCGICLGTPLRFTHNGDCVHCCRLAAIDYYNTEVARGVSLNALEAKNQGVSNYVVPEMCGKAGHVGLRNLDNECVLCVKAKASKPVGPSPRQAAKAAGHRWYMPVEPCGKCGQLAERYVANGRCRGCDVPKGVESGRTEAERILIRNYPDLIIDRDRAIREGLDIYRTGIPCPHRHTTYRRVADKGCILCR